MGKRISEAILQERINLVHGVGAITLVPGTYFRANKLAQFIDVDCGKWSCRPDHILNGHKHPKRGHDEAGFKQRLSLEEFKQKLFAVHKNIVSTVPESVYIKSSIKILLKDSTYGEFWITPNSVLGGCGHPQRAIYKNITPVQNVIDGLKKIYRNKITLVADTYKSKNHKAQFIDIEYGSFWSTPNKVLKGHGHPTSGHTSGAIKRTRLYTANGETLQDWCKQRNIPYDTVKNNALKYGLETAVNMVQVNIDENGTYKSSQTSLETLFIELFKSTFSDIIKWNKKPLEGDLPYKPDFRFANKDTVLYIDIHGLYWHSDQNRDKKYHLNKAIDFRKQNISYLQIFEDELVKHPNIIRSIILNKLGMSSDKYFARKLDLKVVDSMQARQFLDNNHLMGYKISTAIGLFNGNELVSILTYKNKKNHIELERFATKLNTSCVGGFGKLVNYLKQFNKPIVSYCDLRYANGKSYEKCGFIVSGETLGWQWTDGKNRFNRLACKAGNGKTEKENANEKKWFRIYDAGQRKYILK